MVAEEGRGVKIARRVALEVLRRVEAEGAFVQLCLNHALEKTPRLSRQDRALATELVYGVLRWRRRLDWALKAYCHRPLERVEPTLLRLLRLGAYQLLMLDRVPEWATVDEATETARIMRGRHAANFINGVLRSLARGRAGLEWPRPQEDAVIGLGVLQSFPDWMVAEWLERFGEHKTVRLIEALNQPAVRFIRANSLRITPEGLKELLAASAVETHIDEVVGGALRVLSGGDITATAAHQTGMFHIQDGAAQAACLLLDPRPGERVLDACSAPGGKTATLAQLMKNQGELYAADVHPARLSLVRELSERLGITMVKCFTQDLAAKVPAEWGSFDRVLLDAPCSGLGVIRRHPETKWRINEKDLTAMAEKQQQLLESVSRVVKPGGYLVYSVCTFSRQECEQAVEKFLARHGEFSISDPRRERSRPWHRLVDAGGILRTWPDEHHLDGFFAVRLQRAPA